jgi:hypothetical protein
VGRYIEPHIKYDATEFEVATDDILALMKEEGNSIKGKSLYVHVEKRSSTGQEFFERNLESLTHIHFFNELDMQEKRDLGI